MATMTTTSNPINSSDPQSLMQLIPGLSGGVNTAMGGIQNLLTGLPSPSLARTTNAYWGVGAGQPAGGVGNTGDINSFIGRLGTDLYGQQAQANRQMGLQDLLSLIGGTSGTLTATPGQALQNQQFNAGQALESQQFNQRLAQDSLNQYMNWLLQEQSILGKNGLLSGNSNPPTMWEGVNGKLYNTASTSDSEAFDYMNAMRQLFGG